MKIEEYKFGSFVIDGRKYLDDIKIINGKARCWSARERHILKLVDVKDLIESKPEIILIGTGASGLLQVSAEIKDEIMRKRIALYTDKTDSACKIFNEIIKKGKRVAALFHATC